MQNEEKVDAIFRLYDLHGADDYIGEAISQLEHMSQSAQLAMQEGYDDEVILAAFFHDIGHICVHGQAVQNMNGYGVVSHEQVGANYLRQMGFPERVARLVEYHVQAKRYLTCRYPEYLAALSEASLRTLAFQGGPMTESEAINFEQDPLFNDSIRMRHWDEMAKEIDTPVMDLSVLKDMALRVLSQSSS